MDPHTRRSALKRLLARRRLPPATRRLLRDVVVAELGAAVAPLLAYAIPIYGSRRWRGGGRRVRRFGRRRWFVAGSSQLSIHAQQRSNLHGLERVLAAADISTARSDRADRTALVASPASRQQMIGALAAPLREPASVWYVRAEGMAAPHALLDAGDDVPSPILDSTTWTLWLVHEGADGSLTTEESAVTVEFSTAVTKRSRRGAAPPAIDIVYTWVNDDDPAWRASLSATRVAAGLPAEDGDDLIRYHSYDELRYSLRTLWRHAGWFRTIHLVTAGQLPEWLEPDERLRVVPHGEILPVDCLPTFNSHAIESRLHHIAGLAEHFVYLNDDVFIGRHVDPSCFFDTNHGNRPYVFPELAHVPPGEHPAGMYRAADVTCRLVEKLTGVTDRRMLQHAPFPLQRSTIHALQELLPDAFNEVAHHQFRHVDDISVAASLAPKWALATGRATERPLSVEYVSLGHPLAGLRLRRLARRQDYDAFCLNTSAADRRGVDARWLARWMERLAPLPSPWERGGRSDTPSIASNK